MKKHIVVKPIHSSNLKFEVKSIGFCYFIIVVLIQSCFILINKETNIYFSYLNKRQMVEWNVILSFKIKYFGIYTLTMTNIISLVLGKNGALSQFLTILIDF